MFQAGGGIYDGRLMQQKFVAECKRSERALRGTGEEDMASRQIDR